MNAHSAILRLLFSLLFLSTFVVANGPTFDLSAMKPPRTSLQMQGDTLLILHVEIDAGWHINADTTADEFLLPSRVELQPVEIRHGKDQWPKPERVYSEALGMENLVLGGKFQIQIPIDLSKWNPSQAIQATLHYQACSHTICLAPSKVTATLEQGSKKKVADESSHSIPLLIFFAFLGGLILNLMPCVLPVLSIKALTLAKHAHEGRGRLLALGGSMTAGILTSFWILALTVIVAKQAGMNAGWGFQFQNPYFVVGMIILMALFALNLFGVFEIWLPSSAQTGISKKASGKGYGGAFFNGALMTLLSTPCSAPFLGAAMGFAFTQDSSTLLLFFTASALGLAFPYLLLSFFPIALRWIPKPGDWMIRFKQFLGFLLLATMVWLLSVLNTSMGSQALDAMFLILLLLGVGAWAIGHFAPPGVNFSRVIVSWIVLALLAMGLGAWQLLPALLVQNQPTASCGDELTKDANGQYRWSPKVVETLRKQGYTVFVDYTADWCLTCKVNEKTILSQSRVQEQLNAKNVAFVVADFTRPNAEISKSLQSFGKSGVPLYVVYPANLSEDPIVLPEIITPDMVIQALKIQ